MAIDTNVITVGVAATLLANSAGAVDPTVGATGEMHVVIAVPTGGQTVFIGGANVTASGAKQGIPIAAASAPFQYDLDLGASLYGIVAATTQATNVLTMIDDDN